MGMLMPQTILSWQWAKYTPNRSSRFKWQ